MDYFKEFASYVEKNELDFPIGSPENEISELESSLDCTLPKSYREYLRMMGNDYNGVMVGTNCFLSDVVSNNEYLPELLEENNLYDFGLPEKYVAFFCHQGYICLLYTSPSPRDKRQSRMPSSA